MANWNDCIEEEDEDEFMREFRAYELRESTEDYDPIELNGTIIH